MLIEILQNQKSPYTRGFRKFMKVQRDFYGHFLTLYSRSCYNTGRAVFQIIWYLLLRVTLWYNAQSTIIATTDDDGLFIVLYFRMHFAPLSFFKRERGHIQGDYYAMLFGHFPTTFSREIAFHIAAI